MPPGGLTGSDASSAEDLTHFLRSGRLVQEKKPVLAADQEEERNPRAVAALQGGEVIGLFVYEGTLVHGNWSRLEEMSGRKRNSQDDTPPCSKINTETESRETREDKTCNVRSLG